MSEVVNLRQFRKRRKREEKETAAEENRARHSVPGAVKRASRAAKDVADKKLDGKKLDPGT